MQPGEKYWSVIEPIWNTVDIYSTEAYARTFASVPRSAGLLFAAHFCQSEVCNGGFAQFFWNSTGVLAPEAIDGFEVIGQRNVANVVRRAIQMLGTAYPRNRADRWNALTRLRSDTENIDEPATSYRNIAVFRPLEDEFYALLRTEAGGFANAADTYASAV